jgi:hypothetical protein
MVKRFSLYLAILLVFTVGPAVPGQKSQQNCDFSIVGTWKAADGGATPLFVTFAADGTIVVRMSPGLEGEILGQGTYKLDYPESPKAIEIIVTKAAGVLALGTTSMAMTVSTDSSFTTTGLTRGPMRWVRLEPARHFLVFAARQGNPSLVGPAFAILIRKEGRQTQIEAAGLYFDNEDKNFGPIPARLYNEFMTEPQSRTDVMLRLEITRGEYERGLKIMRDWERRAREGTLLYPPANPRGLYFDTSILLKQIAESINQCGEKMKLYDLNWRSDDEVAVKYSAPQVPYQYLKRLQELNKKNHVSDKEFGEPGHSTRAGGAQ